MFAAMTVQSAVWHDSPFVYNHGGVHEVSYEQQGDTIPTLSVKTAGKDIYGNYDGGHFVYTGSRGDWEIRATIPSVKKEGANAAINDPHAKMGLMFRQSLDAHSPFVFFNRSTTTSASKANEYVAWRKKVGASVGNTTSTAYPVYQNVNSGAIRYRFVRQGDRFIGYAATNAAMNVWNKVAECTVNAADWDLGPSLAAGVATSPNVSTNAATIELVYRDVVSRPVVKTEVSGSNVVVSWAGDPVLGSGETLKGFRLYRKTADGSRWNLLASPSATTLSYTDAVPDKFTTYQYRLYAMGNSETLVGTSAGVRVYKQTASIQGVTRSGIQMTYEQGGRKVGSLVHYTSIYSGHLTPSDRCYPDGSLPGVVGSDDYSIRANGSFYFTNSGFVSLRLLVNDTIDLSIDGHRAISAPEFVDARTYSAPIWCEAYKRYPIEWLYSQVDGDRHCEIQRRVETASSDSQDYLNGAWLDPIPEGWTAKELGDAAVHGLVDYDCTKGLFTVVGAGGGLDRAWDEAETLTRESGTDDFVLIARADRGSSDGVGGLILRSDLDSSAAVEAVLTLPDESASSFKVRSAANANLVAASSAAVDEAAVKVRLAFVRWSGRLSAWVAEDGSDWRKVGEVAVPQALSKNVRAGVFAHAASRSTSNKVTFDEISLVPADLDFSTAIVEDNGGSVKFSLASGGEATDRIAVTNDFKGYFWADAADSAAVCSDLYLNSDGTSYGRGSRLASTFTYPGLFTCNYATNDPGAVARVTVTARTFWGATKTVTATLSRVTPSNDGNGLSQLLYKSALAGPTGQPNFRFVRGVDADWVQGDNGWYSVGGTHIAQEDFHSVWTGTFIAPYSTHYQFRSTCVNGFVNLHLDGTGEFAKSIVVAGESVNTTPNRFFKAGERVPITVYWRKGAGASSGAFGLKYRASGATGEDFEGIPTGWLSTTRSASNGTVVGKDETFGSWKRVEWNSAKDGQAIFDGVAGSDPANGTGCDEFDLVFLASSENKGIEDRNTSEKGSFVYREVTGNFVFEGTMSASGSGSPWSRQGFAVRCGTASDAPCAAVLRCYNDGSRIIGDHRAKAGGQLVNYRYASNVGYDGVKVRVRMERKGDRLRTWVDDELWYDADVSAWGPRLCAGFMGSSWDVNYYNLSVFQSVKLDKPMPMNFTVHVR